MNWENFLQVMVVENRLGLVGWPESIRIRSTAYMLARDVTTLLKGFLNESIKFEALSDAKVEDMRTLLEDIRSGHKSIEDSPYPVRLDPKRKQAEKSLQNLRRGSSIRQRNIEDPPVENDPPHPPSLASHTVPATSNTNISPTGVDPANHQSPTLHPTTPSFPAAHEKSARDTAAYENTHHSVMPTSAQPLLHGDFAFNISQGAPGAMSMDFTDFPMLPIGPSTDSMGDWLSSGTGDQAFANSFDSSADAFYNMPMAGTSGGGASLWHVPQPYGYDLTSGGMNGGGGLTYNQFGDL